MSKLRVGQGFDAHRLVEGRKLVLGGVVVPYEKGLLGHSDADVLTHAVMSAILGALALGDLGHHFPPEDPKYKDADSIKLLRRVVAMAAGKGYRVEQVDATVIAEEPRLAPHIPEMCQNLARAMGAAIGDVSVKATTMEGAGTIGRGEVITVMAVALLEQKRISRMPKRVVEKKK